MTVTDVDWFSVLVHLIIGGALLWTGVRGRQGRLSMDGPGIRTPTTLASEEAWRIAHEAAGALLAAAGGLAALTGLLLIPFGEGRVAAVLTGVGTGGAVVLAVAAARRGLRAVRDA